MESSISISNEFSKRENSSKERIVDFYNEATEDYLFWSKDLNMHFGYFKWFSTNPWKRDSMLNEMNDQVYRRLGLKDKAQVVADLGCGMGGTMRHFLKKNPKLFMFGVTLSDFQVSEGNTLLKDHNGIICNEDYSATTLTYETMDGVIAIESLCHSGHNYQSLAEGYRILKLGGKFVITDAFLKKDPSELSASSNYCYQHLCKGWSLDGLGTISKVREDLYKIGFSKVEVEDVSNRIAPSVLHVPFAIPGFILKTILKNKPVKKQSWNNLKASFFALLSGFQRRSFGYYIITASK